MFAGGDRFVFVGCTYVTRAANSNRSEPKEIPAMVIRSCCFLTALAGASLAALAGCTTEETASLDLSTEAATLAGAEDSLASTEDAAKACFDTFKTCADTATDDAGKAACRDALKTCLPDDARDPRKCKGPPPGGPRGRGDGGPPPRGEGPDTAEGAGVDLQNGPPPNPGEGQRADGRRPPPPDGADGGRPPGHGHGGGACKRPPVPKDRIEKCRVDAASAEGDAAATEEAHRACVRRAFSEKIAEICKRATSACSNEDADATVCEQITALCASQSDTEAATSN